MVALELSSLQSKVRQAINDFRGKYESFDEAFATYTAEYGDNSVKVYEPFRISGTIDPVCMILGRNTTLFYQDSKRRLNGSLGSAPIVNGSVYVLGRREAVDSRLMVWSPEGEVEIEKYDSRVKVIPSRIHAAIFALEDGEVIFSDLGSSSGSILVGETNKPEPFIVLYATPKVEVHRVTIEGKYGPKKRS